MAKAQILKKYNIDLIQKLIIKKGPISKPELSHLTNLSLPTVNKLVDELLEEEYIIEDAFQTGAGAGRKAMTYVVNGNYGTFLILYYLDERWIGCVSNILGDILYKAEYSLSNRRTEEQFQVLCDIIEDLMNNAQRIKAIGIGIPGIVMNDDSVAAIPMFPEFEGLQLKNELSKKYKIPVFIENDVKLMTLGYHSLKMKHVENMVYMYIGEGVGGGIILNGKLYKGNTSFAGEFGYIPSNNITFQKKELNGGSLELLLLEIKKRMKNSETYQEALELFCEEIGRSLVSCIATLNPEAVVLYCNELNVEVLKNISQEIEKYLPSHCVPQIVLTKSDSYGIHGLIYLCQDGLHSKSVFDEEFDE